MKLKKLRVCTILSACILAGCGSGKQQEKVKETEPQTKEETTEDSGTEEISETRILFGTNEGDYRWTVENIQLNGCTYFYLKLGCNNGTITMKNNVSKQMSSCGSKDFTAKKTGSDTYMEFVVSMEKDTYDPVYDWRIDIIDRQ